MTNTTQSIAAAFAAILIVMTSFSAIVNVPPSTGSTLITATVLA
jgi:hypothetical protein